MARARGKGPGASLGSIESAASKRRAARQSPFESYAARPGFDWEGVDAASFLDGVAHALTRGAAITLSLTADGGAVKLTIWLDNNRHAGYAADADILNEMTGSLQEVEPASED